MKKFLTLLFAVFVSLGIGIKAQSANKAVPAEAGTEQSEDDMLAAYEADVEQWQDLTQAFQALQNDTDFPGYYVANEAQFAAVAKQLQDLYNAIQEALEAAGETGVYESPAQSLFSAATDAVMALNTGKIEALNALDALAGEDSEQLLDIEEAINGLKNDSEFPGFAVLNATAISEIEADYNALYSAIETAAENAFNTGVYEGPEQSLFTALTEKVMGLLADRQEQYTAIMNAYDADMATVNKYYDAIKDVIDAEGNEQSEAYQAALPLLEKVATLKDEIKTAAQTALLESGVYTSPVTKEDVAELDAMLNAQNIMAVYEEDIDQWQELTSAFQALQNDTDFPGYYVANEAQFAAVAKQLQDLYDAIQAALEAAGETGVYEGPAQSLFTAATEAVMALNTGKTEALNALDALVGEDSEQLLDIEEAINGLKNDSEFPGFAVLNATAISEAEADYNTLYAAVEAAAENAFNTGVYEGPEQSQFTALTEKVMGLLAERQEQYTAIMNAYDADMADVNAYYEKIKDVIDAEGNDDTEAYQAALPILEKVATLKDAIKAAAQTALVETGAYVSPVTAEDIAELDAMEDAFGILQAYDEDIEQWQELAQTFEALQNNDEFPGYATFKAEEFSAVAQQLQALYDAIQAALEKAADTGIYDGPSQSQFMAVTDAIMALNTGMAEALVELDNLVGEDSEQLLDIEEAIEGLKNDNEFPAFAEVNADAIDAVEADYNALYNKVVDAATAAAQTGVYEGPAQSEFMALTEKVMGLAADRQEQYTAIMNGYEDDLAKVDEYYNKIKDVIDAEDNEESEEYEAALPILEKVAELKDAIKDAARAALIETCAYTSPVTAEDIAELDELMKAFDSVVGIISIEADMQGAIFFDLNGNQVKNPVNGKVYIKVVNGKASKVYVK